MITINPQLKPEDLRGKLKRFWALSAAKLNHLESHFDPAEGAPVYTVQGRYTARGWTDWTQGFQYGSALIQFDAEDDQQFLEMGRRNTLQRMPSHVTHFGIHDHGFHNVSTFGQLLRLAREERMETGEWEQRYYELAMKCSAAVQARRWTPLSDELGYIYSFNGPHSLFADTIRSLRALALGFQLGHTLLEENDRPVSLLDRLVRHARTTADYNVYYGNDRDLYDVRGRVAHESLFNVVDGSYRCPGTQQGYAPFSTWTRGLAWVMCGFAEQLEFIHQLDPGQLEPLGRPEEIRNFMREAAEATCDFYIENAAADGIPYWDTGAPNLHRIPDALERPADPFNEFEPVDSSAAAIAAQGLLRLGQHLEKTGQGEEGARYRQAGLTVLDTLLGEPYLSTEASHQGLILHSVYHRPNGWDHVPKGRKIPCGESSMWGDYHAREAALYVQRLLDGRPYLKFYL